LNLKLFNIIVKVNNTLHVHYNLDYRTDNDKKIYSSGLVVCINNKKLETKIEVIRRQTDDL